MLAPDEFLAVVERSRARRDAMLPTERAEWWRAVTRGDAVEIARLEAKAEERMAAARRHLAGEDH